MQSSFHFELQPYSSKKFFNNKTFLDLLSEASTPIDNHSNISLTLNSKKSLGVEPGSSNSYITPSATTSTNSSASLYPSTPPTLITTSVPRILPHLQPQRFLPILNHQSSSTSPTSTCSSPLNHHLLDTSTAHMPGNYGLTQLTPPQSAPPQKTSQNFFVDQRYRSKSILEIKKIFT